MSTNTYRMRLYVEGKANVIMFTIAMGTTQNIYHYLLYLQHQPEKFFVTQFTSIFIGVE